MILAALRQRTGHLHDRVERAVDLPARLRSPAAYAGLLARLHGFYTPLEARLAAVAGYETVGLDVGVRLKARLLRDDLRALGYPPEAADALPRCAALPAVPGLAAALGCLYVLDGATLGGQVIRGAVGRALGLAPGAGCSFFSSYGDRVGEMWAQLCAALAAYAGREPGAEGPIVSAAADTFTRLEEWVAC